MAITWVGFLIVDDVSEALMFLSHIMGDMHQVCSSDWDLIALKYTKNAKCEVSD